RGDASDNIPGVPGIGDKTATRLLQAHGSVEGILAHLDAIDDKTSAKLRAHEDQLRLNKQLVTIDRHAPVTLDLAAARFGDYDRDQVLALFRELAFSSLAPRLLEIPQGETPAVAQPPVAESVSEVYHTVTTRKDLDALVRKMQAGAGFAFDVEATSVDELTAGLVGISIGVGAHEAYYIPVGHQAPNAAPLPPPAPKKAKENQLSMFDAPPAPAPITQDLPAAPPVQLDRQLVLDRLAPVFANPRIPKFAHNARYDVIVLAEAGVATRGLTFDTLIAAQLLESSGQKLGLKELAFAKFNAPMTQIQELIGKGKNQITMAHVAIEKAAPYACADADYTYRLMELYRAELADKGLVHLFYDLEMPLVPVIVELERAGVLLDTVALSRLSVTLAARLQDLEARVYEQVGGEFNLGSPQQLSEALFVKLGLPSKGLERTRTGQISTAAGILEDLRPLHPVIALILEHRELSKLKGTYVDALPQLINARDGRLHTSFNQTGTVTGRISSSNPNLQNIPVKTELGRQVRRAFIAPKGQLLLSADYSQVELRILAHVSRDENLLQAFAAGEDIHVSTAARLFNVPVSEVTSEQRRLGKTMNFGIVYGISNWGVAGRTDLSLEASRDLIDKYFEKYPRIREYIDRTKELARTQGYVESLMGRRRYFPELASGKGNPGLRNQAEREAINMPIQATAADIIKQAMVNLAAALAERKLTSRMILQVHDELVLEVPPRELDPVAHLIREVMETAYRLDAPLRVDVAVGPNWDEMEAYKV
ncbi:MAG: DNA polymerase I, partial [Anaerolineae bacterium]